MRTYHLLVASLLLLVDADISQAANGDDTSAGSARANPTTSVGATANQSFVSAGVVKNLADLTDAQIQAQIAALQAESAKRKQVQLSGSSSKDKPKQSSGTAKPTQSATGDTARFQKLYLRELGYPNEAAAAPPKPAPADPCNPQQLFIRANSLDNYLYGITPASKAKGASITYTDDSLAGTKSATINGMISYVALRNLCPPTPPGDGPFFSGYSIAPFVLGQGNYTQPQVKTEHSALQFGVENEFEISRGLLPRQVFTVAPYFQTDYRDEARASGVNVKWQPYDAELHLGGYIDTNPYLGWFVQLQGEVNALDVNSVGVTNLTKSNYDWIGGTVALNMYFLPAALDVPDIIRNRFAFYATGSYFTDARSGMDIHYYTARLSYKITPDGSSSISIEYDNGTQLTTLVAAKQYLVGLTYAY
jgi:hypothetical protein